MKLWMWAVSSLVSTQLFAQEPNLIIYSEFPNSHENVEQNFDNISQSLQIIHAQIAKTLHSKNFIDSKLSIPQTSSVLSTVATVSVDQFFIDYQQGVAFEDVLHSNLEQLAKKDPYNWFPHFIKYVKRLEKASASLYECTDFSCTNENYNERLEALLHFLSRFTYMMKTIESNIYLLQSVPTFSYGLEDTYYITQLVLF